MNITQQVIYYIVSFLAGTTVGFLLRGVVEDWLEKTFKDRKPTDIELLSPFVGVLVAIVWLVAVLVSLVNPAQTVDIELHLIMGGIVGALFNKNIFGRIGKDDK